MRRPLLPTLLLLLLLLPACEEMPRKGVLLRCADLNDDGERELVIENRLVKLVVLRPENKGEEKYDSRFVWGGWITDVILKPINFNAVIGGFFQQGDIDWKKHPTGLPAEFEKRILINSEGETATFLKIGVGEMKSRKLPDGRWAKGKLIKTFPWTMSVLDMEDGSKKITFAQSGASGSAAYTLTNSIIVPPDKPTFGMEVSLGNTGDIPLDTDWYVHPFFSFGGFGGKCWQCIPLSLGGGRMRYECFALPTMEAPGTVWGWLTPREIGNERWYATGCEKNGAFMVVRWNYETLRIRNWLHGHTYAIEPFVKLDLKPGEARTWCVDVMLGSGMDGVNRAAPEGALSVQRNRGNRIRVKFYAAAHLKDVSFRMAIREGSKEVRFIAEKVFGTLAPGETAQWECNAGENAYGRAIKVSVLSGGMEILSHQLHCPTRENEAFERKWRERMRGKKVLVALGAGDERTMLREKLYLQSCLKNLGVNADFFEGEIPALEGYRILLMNGAVKNLEAEAIRKWLEKGNGLFACAPFPSSLSEILPVSGGELIESEPFRWNAQRSGDEQFESLWSRRWHLQRVAPHPITDGLPFWSETNQSIGRFYRVAVKRGGRVLLRYSPVHSPALVVGRVGNGRVAVMMNPVLWGEPRHWILWGAFSEYHRELLQRTVGWVAGAMEP